MREGESWARVGATFAVLASIATGVYLWFAFGAEAISRPWTSWAVALLVALPLSASNALVEEVVTRWGVLAAMPEDWARFGPLASAVLFGAIHWFGIPGGPVGAVMAGFLAWVLARSSFDTRGIGWAWFIHFCQDVLIFTATLVLFV
ncbi:CPBP family glutamic-type intramembrane protease [Actinomyces culturomici]|uniref:CPBP family glutamic-type intramembrane protease n=1 Tax=Actinomyces culturomici TaxID=1926276 RepID=UPI00135830E7|nr:CPBP family glutamic-type intramembrane protease [Actinomyces culturomici]